MEDSAYKKEILKAIFEHPSVTAFSAVKLYKKAKEIVPELNITHKDVKQFLEAQSTVQQFKTNKIKHYYPIQAYAYHNFQRIQIDLVDMQNEIGRDRNSFVFFAIDVFSRY